MIRTETWVAAAEDGLEQQLAYSRVDLLGVVQQRERPRAMAVQCLVVEQDARHDQRPGERASPGLVGACDEPHAESAVVPQ